MKVLGINAVFHDPAASLVLNGRIVAAAEEERFSRRKHGKRPVPFATWELPEQALGRPSVLLFGPTPPALWGPPPGALHTVLWKGRRSDPLADRPAPGLLAIRPREVTAALAAL